MFLKHKRHVIELYDSIDDLSIRRFQLYNLNVLIDAGVGGDLDSFHSRITATKGLIKVDPDKAIKEVENMRMSVIFIMSKMTPEFRSFVALIKRIDGRWIEDNISDSRIEELLDEISSKRFPIVKIKEALGIIKKKIGQEFELFFRSLGQNSQAVDYYLNLIDRSILQVREINGEDVREKLEQIDLAFLSMLKPKIFFGKNGVEVKSIVSFEDTCIILSQYKVSSRPDEMSTLSFYRGLDIVKQQIKNANQKR